MRFDDVDAVERDGLLWLNVHCGRLVVSHRGLTRPVQKIRTSTTNTLYPVTPKASSTKSEGFRGIEKLRLRVEGRFG